MTTDEFQDCLDKLIAHEASIKNLGIDATSLLRLLKRVKKEAKKKARKKVLKLGVKLNVKKVLKKGVKKKEQTLQEK